MDERLTTRGKIDHFIAGLERLTEETGLVLSGCGCCDSPYLYQKRGPGAYEADIDDVKGKAGFGIGCRKDGAIDEPLHCAGQPTIGH